MIRRYVAALGVAAVVTFGLFFLMQSLIAVSAVGDLAAVSGRVVDFVRIKKESDIETKKRRLPKRAEPLKPPPPPDLDLSKAPKPQRADLGAATLVAVPTLDLARGPGLGAAASDADIVPLVRIEPRYPDRALSRGTEGWVLLEFTITPAGTVRDITVVDSEPSGIFDRAAKRAVLRWKYKPKVVDGVPVERTGVQVVLTFEIED
jgi:protein TonB